MIKHSRFLVSLFLALLAAFSPAAENSDLKAELIGMQTVDQEMRVWKRELNSEEAQSVDQKLGEIEAENSDRLKAIVAQFGWPHKALVGNEGVAAAFFIIENSPDTSFQQAMLPELERSFINNEGVSGPDLALFEDRLLVKLGKKQKYGTQIYMSANKAVLIAIENEEKVDELRAEKGLMPLETYLNMISKLHGEIHRSKDEQPESEKKELGNK